MTLKRLGLIILTLVAILFAGSSLLSSWQEPQFQSRLELYQTNLVLQAASWEPLDDNSANFKSLQDALLGVKPLESATEQYQEARKSAQTNLEKAKKQLAQLQSEPATTPTTPKPQPELPPATNTSRQVQQQQLQQSVNQLQKLIPELDLRLGILQAQQGKIETAQKTWSQLQQRSDINPEFEKAAAVLAGAKE
jgi:tetratricopeptide (TPR) repeat protein